MERERPTAVFLWDARRHVYLDHRLEAEFLVPNSPKLYSEQGYLAKHRLAATYQRFDEYATKDQWPPPARTEHVTDVVL